ncbi:MAG: haloacid dehalogenase-like hydrolase, partial [Oscillospiraceae bacterium]|nr:haloacid dehalogenase-like hydrolase [Oscillospiraceae bacterium]
MKMMRAYGGQAVAVYQDGNRPGVEDLLAKGRVDFIFPADYSEGTMLDTTMKNIIRKMAITDLLAEENQEQLRRLGRAELPNQVELF